MRAPPGHSVGGALDRPGARQATTSSAPGNWKTTNSDHPLNGDAAVFSPKMDYLEANCIVISFSPVGTSHRVASTKMSLGDEEPLLTANKLAAHPTAKPLKFVWGSANGRAVKMLIYTGAQVCVMSETLYAAIGGRLHGATGKIKVADNSTVACLGQLSVMVTLGQRLYQVDVAVLPNLSYPFILGHYVLDHDGAIIDQASRVLRIGEDVLPFARDSWSSAEEVRPVADTVLEEGLNVVDIFLPP